MFTVAILPSIFVVPLPVITNGVPKAVPAVSSLAVQYFSKSVAFVPAVSMAPVAALVFTATRGSIGSPSAL